MNDNRVSNVGHYIPPRYTCYSCYHDIEGGKPGIMRCPSCSTLLLLKEEQVPEFITQEPEEFEIQEWEDEHGPIR